MKYVLETLSPNSLHHSVTTDGPSVHFTTPSAHTLPIGIFKEGGYTISTGPNVPLEAQVIFTFEYPFGATPFPALHPGQRINHMPGLGQITHKKSLVEFRDRHADTLGQFMPPGATTTNEWLKLQLAHPDAHFVTKSEHHRGIKIRDASTMNLIDGTIAQLLLPRPLLISGYKFDVVRPTLLSTSLIDSAPVTRGWSLIQKHPLVGDAPC